jgi:hypothetical protein
LWGSKVHLKGFEKRSGCVGQSVNAHATIRAGNWLLLQTLPTTIRAENAAGFNASCT